VNQLRLFAKVVRDGHSSKPRWTRPCPSARRRGPTCACARSASARSPCSAPATFPLAFSVAGGDTASALAAGCPVVVKAHGAHLGTSELVGKAVRQAPSIDCGMPEGVFSMLFGEGRQIGQALVAHPAIKAVGFTGSRQGGLALMRTRRSARSRFPCMPR
jgi:alpha-ketoglutaric semialdehyde dehydrogenase